MGMLTFRATEDDIQRLKDLEKLTGLTRSEILRELIRIAAAEIKVSPEKFEFTGKFVFASERFLEQQQVKITNYAERVQEILDNLKSAANDLGDETAH